MADTHSIEERLLSAQLATNNALTDSGILAALTVYGYNAEKITVGKNLTDEVSESITKQKKEYGEQYEATAALNDAWSAADQEYMKTLKIARIALRDNVMAQNALGLSGYRKRSLSGWLEQAGRFYQNLIGDSDLVTALSAYGYTAEKLQSEKALVDAVRNANMVQEKEKGEARDATEKRDARVDEMDHWIADFKSIAQIALGDNPQWLDKLGF